LTRVTPIPGQPAILISSRKSTLCVADLHIGYELELREGGFNIPPQIDNILQDITGIDEGDHLLILGDLKHTVTGARRRERFELAHFFRSLRERFSSISVVMGNHDGGLDRDLPDGIVAIRPTGVRIGTIGLAHGHCWPSEDVVKAKTLLWGHLHPSLRMTDRLGGSVNIKCWLRGGTSPEKLGRRYKCIDVRESIVIPAFNRLLVGSPVNENAKPDLSPLTRSGYIDISEQEAYTLEGVRLGTVQSLVRGGKRRRI